MTINPVRQMRVERLSSALYNVSLELSRLLDTSEGVTVSTLYDLRSTRRRIDQLLEKYADGDSVKD